MEKAIIGYALLCMRLEWPCMYIPLSGGSSVDMSNLTFLHAHGVSVSRCLMSRPVYDKLKSSNRSRDVLRSRNL